MGEDKPRAPTERSEVERLAIVEAEQSAIQKRLNEGADTFGEIRNAFEKVTERWAQQLEAMQVAEHAEHDSLRSAIKELTPKPLGSAKILALVAGPVVFVGTLIWAASRYPERGEFLDVQRQLVETKSREHDLERDLQNLRDDVRRALDATAKGKP